MAGRPKTLTGEFKGTPDFEVGSTTTACVSREVVLMCGRVVNAESRVHGKRGDAESVVTRHRGFESHHIK